MAKQVIALCNLKGGTAKTTSSVYISACLHARGKSVTLIDLDNEQSALNWGVDGGLPFRVVAADSNSLLRMVKAELGNVVIDTPPNNRKAMLKAAELADIVIVPVAPTTQDVNRLTPTLELLADVEEKQDTDKVSILLVRYNKRRILAREFLEMFAEYPLLDNKISERAAYQNELGTMPVFLDEYNAVLDEVANGS